MLKKSKTVLNIVCSSPLLDSIISFFLDIIVVIFFYNFLFATRSIPKQNCSGTRVKHFLITTLKGRWYPTLVELFQKLQFVNDPLVVFPALICQLHHFSPWVCFLKCLRICYRSCDRPLPIYRNNIKAKVKMRANVNKETTPKAFSSERYLSRSSKLLLLIICWTIQHEANRNWVSISSADSYGRKRIKFTTTTTHEL